jgi:ribonuclease BN (tRNA processing enzyme)
MKFAGRLRQAQPGEQMKVTIVGCGDAFGSGGRSHTCFRLDAAGRTLLVDFGASAIVAWNRLGFATADIDAVVVSHLHGDHFGGLPFLLLHCHFVERRRKPLLLIGPPGFKARLDALIEVFFPGTKGMAWTFAWPVEEIPPGRPHEAAGFSLLTREVDHPSGAPSTAVRVEGGGRVFAYSGDTAWTEALIDIADGADLLLMECYSAKKPIPGHIDWPTLDANLGRLKARRLMLTHMSEDEDAGELRAALAQQGIATCHDGYTIEL